MKAKILFISHDANRAGAQLFLLNIMKDFKAAGVQMSLLCLSKWGALLPEFEELCTVEELPKSPNYGLSKIKKVFSKDLNQILQNYIKEKFLAEKFDFIYANTVATACSASLVKNTLELPLITHIHELQFSLELYANDKDRQDLFNSSDGIIACSQAVKDNLILNYPTLAPKTSVIHSFVDNDFVLDVFKNSNKDQIKNDFKLPKDSFLVGACGNAEWRKGLDIFTNLVSTTIKSRPEAKVHFVWIGLKPEGEYYEQIMYDVRKMNIAQHITFIAPTPKAVEIINALDVFTVSSREDPFPLVMLEAALCQKPILGFENTGGCSEFVKDEAGLLSEYLNVNGMSENLFSLMENSALRSTKGKNGQNSILENYSFKHSVAKLKTYLNQFLPSEA